jgi:geranylgeranyl reductase family protein
MWDFDLLIVGAGPGGSNAAAVALNAGLKVAQIDAARFPRVKPCAGGISIKAAAALQTAIGASSSFNTIEFSLWGRRRNRFAHVRPVLHTVCRPQFDAELVQQNLSHRNFTFLDGHRATAVHYDGRFTVTTSRGVLTAAQLIGADGAYSIVNRTFRVATPRVVATALEINLPNRAAAQHVPCLDYGAIPYGYGWVFPKTDHLSVGLYTLAPRTRNIRTELCAYARSKGLADGESAAVEAFRLPVGGFVLRAPKCPVYIVGDAGGFADALTGEGIYYALESGRLAGETAVDVASGDQDHHAYYRRLWRTVLCDTAATYFVAKAFYHDLDRGLRALEHPLVWRPLIEGAAGGSTFTDCVLSALLLRRSPRSQASLERCGWRASTIASPDRRVGRPLGENT